MDIKTINYEYFLDLSVRMTHHSNAIEGNTLTLNETATIILDRLNDNAGNFKRNSNAIIGANFETSTPSQAPIFTKNWIENLNYKLELCKNDDEKLLEILNSHIEFERIHPFSDGNGRTGRLIMMYLCFQEKISPFVIEKNDRALYMNYLREQNTDIIFDKVKELQEFEKRRMEQF